MALTLDDLNPVPTGGISEEDMDKFDGSKTKIASIVPEEMDSIFCVEKVKIGDVEYKPGDPLPEGYTQKGYVAIVKSEQIGMDALGQPVVVTEHVSLKKHPHTGKWGPSLHEKSKAKKLMTKYKVNTLKECIGQPIVVIKKIGEKSGKPRLCFSI